MRFQNSLQKYLNIRGSRVSLDKIFDFDDYVFNDMKDMESAGEYNTYVIGDIHGNAQKLMYFLFHTGIVLASKAVQEGIRKSYKTKDYALFKESIKKLVIHKLNIKTVKLILIGDTLCDRGQSDFMILLIYKLLFDNKVNFTICLSNHDSAFIHQMDHFINSDIFCGNFTAKPACSFDLNKLSKDDLDMCVNIYTNIYLPRLKFVVYLKGPNKQEIICSHAPCNYKMINYICPNAKNLSLRDLVDTVNKKLQNSISNNNFCYDWIEGEGRCYNFIWNREVVQARNRGRILNIFGHVGSEDDIVNDYQINLDTDLGKVPQKRLRGRPAIGELRYCKFGSDLEYKIRRNLPIIKREAPTFIKNENEKLRKELVNLITEVNNSSSSRYSGSFRSNRKQRAFEKIKDICVSMELTVSQVIRVIKIMAIIASIPRGETTNRKKIARINNKTIKKTKSSKELLDQLSMSPRIIKQLEYHGIVINSYKNLIDFCGQSINDLYLNKVDLYKRVDNLEQELNEI